MAPGLGASFPHDMHGHAGLLVAICTPRGGKEPVDVRETAAPPTRFGGGDTQRLGTVLHVHVRSRGTMSVFVKVCNRYGTAWGSSTATHAVSPTLSSLTGRVWRVGISQRYLIGTIWCQGSEATACESIRLKRLARSEAHLAAATAWNMDGTPLCESDGVA